MNLSILTPFELGETNDANAIPFLQNFLSNGAPNEKRLAASAVRKLLKNFPSECSVLKDSLLSCVIYSESPQTIHYSLKTLHEMNLEQKDLDLIYSYFSRYKEDYNIDASKKLLIKHRYKNNFLNPITTKEVSVQKKPSEFIANILVSETNIPNTSTKSNKPMYIVIAQENFTFQSLLLVFENVKRDIEIFCRDKVYNLEILTEIKTYNSEEVFSKLKQQFQHKTTDGVHFNFDVSDILWIKNNFKNEDTPKNSPNNDFHLKSWDIFLKEFNEKTIFNFAYINDDKKEFLFKKMSDYNEFITRNIEQYKFFLEDMLVEDFLSKNISLHENLDKKILKSSQFKYELKTHLNYFLEKSKLENLLSSKMKDSKTWLDHVKKVFKKQTEKTKIQVGSEKTSNNQQVKSASPSQLGSANRMLKERGYTFDRKKHPVIPENIVKMAFSVMYKKQEFPAVLKEYLKLI